MPKRLIRLMELKEKHLGKFFFSGAIRKDIMSWDGDTVKMVINSIVEVVEDGDVDDCEICPYCIVTGEDCNKCLWKRVHGLCRSKGSLYRRYAEDPNGYQEANLFEDLDHTLIIDVLRSDYDPCPECGRHLVDGKGGGVVCSCCDYWFCF